MNQDERNAHMKDQLAEAINRYDRHQANAVGLLAQATCDEIHECQDHCEPGACECDLTCLCMDPDNARELANAEATLAAAAAQAANTWALLLTKD